MSVAALSMHRYGGFLIGLKSLYYTGMVLLLILLVLNNLRYETHMTKRLMRVEAICKELSKRNLRFLDLLIVVVLCIVIFYAPIFLLLTGAVLNR